jgi:hypothetical protein
VADHEILDGKIDGGPSFSQTQVLSFMRIETEILKNKVFKPYLPNISFTLILK